METSDSGVEPQGTCLEDALAECLESKQNKSPNYRQNLERVVTDWIGFCADRGLECVEEVTERHLAAYAGHLARRVEAGTSGDVDSGITASTAWTYYDYVSSFLAWAVKWNYLAENPAAKGRPRESMPDRPSSGEYDRQYWQPEQRQAVLEFVRRRVDSAYVDPTAPPSICHKRLRNWAFVATIAYSGVRGGEILNDPNDPRRSGLRWTDVNLEDGTMWILGKNQDREPAQLPDQAAHPLERWYNAYDPPSDDWPVFPSMHVPTLSRRLGTAIGTEERDRRTKVRGYWVVALEAEAEPPSITTEGGRSIMRRLSDTVPIPGLEDGEYLTLHGARRGVGETLYRERGAARAQRTLRHADPQTTSEMYSHIDASELAEDNTEVFEDEQ
ncbi:tyrosine-type recombinase/integrase [Natrialbaceae archaeon AArc-T1-2]|uniref:tyrosine-type recombinase/integrase n=1 Tax=Natrialbaceae archaeon AArc-T1-2 TaxID=3053904 RepID=UPI00255AC68B|nr:site-specific integrase [Natrialbaceae archaeon AArc-T1-2]WIV68724.1 site-specific integrase [Natrialbaceae archaeon AArc-T1-2]